MNTLLFVGLGVAAWISLMIWLALTRSSPFEGLDTGPDDSTLPKYSPFRPVLASANLLAGAALFAMVVQEPRDWQPFALILLITLSWPALGLLLVIRRSWAWRAAGALLFLQLTVQASTFLLWLWLPYYPVLLLLTGIHLIAVRPSAR